MQQLEQVIQQNASAAEEMASTTEQLTGQSDQLVSALGFFRTGSENGGPAYQPAPQARTLATASKAASLHASPAYGASSRARKLNGHSTNPVAQVTAKSGVNLRLQDKNDELDGEFERY